jgi:hypothetical protein
MCFSGEDLQKSHYLGTPVQQWLFPGVCTAQSHTTTVKTSNEKEPVQEDAMNTEK